ncbi:DNA invertase Pin-like site-specific DNA recombinase [Alkalibacillus flavidus]|uniref:DNA invertase Pin-like site-specific DNA recombinase n=1 Tax=Alkalibacillus flavidus TaxID=546021 RepID=A0ABV2KY16_9BACI
MIVGYARVSTEDQSLDIQEQAIREYAEKLGERVEVYKEKESGGKADRKELEYALKATHEGDKFVVYKLDRLARSTKQLYEISDRLKDKGVEFISIRDNIDTTTSTGRAMFGMLSVFAEFERDIIRERTQAGLQSARKKGKVGGRPTIDDKTKKQIRILYDQGERAKDIATEYGIGRSTVYKIINESK